VQVRFWGDEKDNSFDVSSQLGAKLYRYRKQHLGLGEKEDANPSTWPKKSSSPRKRGPSLPHQHIRACVNKVSKTGSTSTTRGGSTRPIWMEASLDREKCAKGVRRFTGEIPVNMRRVLSGIGPGRGSSPLGGRAAVP